VPLFQEQLLKGAMICADFSGGEAEELRRAFGFKRSEARMKEIEVKLRRGMARRDLQTKRRMRSCRRSHRLRFTVFLNHTPPSFALIA